MFDSNLFSLPVINKPDMTDCPEFWPQKTIFTSLNDPSLIATRRYSPLRGLTSSSCGGLRPTAEAFFALPAKKRVFYAVFAYFRPFLVFSSNFSNFK